MCTYCSQVKNGQSFNFKENKHMGDCETCPRDAAVSLVIAIQEYLRFLLDGTLEIYPMKTIQTTTCVAPGYMYSNGTSRDLPQTRQFCLQPRSTRVHYSEPTSISNLFWVFFFKHEMKLSNPWQDDGPTNLPQRPAHLWRIFKVLWDNPSAFWMKYW